ncbi:MAG: CoA transferase [Gemmatimonadetes bacterium]|nr:CoA transferase [Gemmatimonadota bacterium]
MEGALEGIRVVDLTQVMAGPFCTMLLADLGADVIKVERPGTGDLSRHMGGAGLRMRGDDRAPFFALNRNKRSIELDLTRSDHRETLLALAETADVMVESFRPGVSVRLGIDYDAIARVQPRIIYASISGFGQSGPWADRPGFDLIAQGMSGVISVTGEPGGAPVKCGIPISDLSAGLHAAYGILAALHARERTGRGQYLETSLFDSALALTAWEASAYWATGEPPRALGTAHRLSAPYQAFRAKDGWITIAALTRAQWRSLCQVLDRDALAADARFADNAGRMANLPDLVREIEAALSTDSANAWVDRLLAAGIPAGPILGLEHVFSEPHTQARRMVEHIEHPVEGRVRTLGFPVKLHGTPARVRRPPPRLGEHTDEILRELRARGPRPRDRQAHRPRTADPEPAP